MPRKPRIQYPGAIYHIIQRGNNKNKVFPQSRDKRYLLKQIENAVIQGDMELFAYVILDNHYHLALRSGSTPISKVMHGINAQYAMRFNKLYQRTGHVFDGRYKAIPVKGEHYLLSLIRYIHLNPVRAGILPHPEDYFWSSDRCYRNLQPSFVNWELMLSIFSNHLSQALDEYIKFMSEKDDLAFENISEIYDTKSKEDWAHLKSEIPNLDEILKNSGVNMEDYNLIRQGSRIKRLIPYKKTYAQLAGKLGYTQKEIGEFINLSKAAINKLTKGPGP